MLRIPMTLWQRLSQLLYFVGLALLVLVLVPAVVAALEALDIDTISAPASRIR